MGRILFITGTGTDVGKTALSLAVLLWAKHRGLNAAYLKPVQCGNFPFGNPPREGGDADWIRTLSGGMPAYVTCALPLAASPHLAAEREGILIDPARLRREAETHAAARDLLILEGAGGAGGPTWPAWPGTWGLPPSSPARPASAPCIIPRPPSRGCGKRASAWPDSPSAAAPRTKSRWRKTTAAPWANSWGCHFSERFPSLRPSPKAGRWGPRTGPVFALRWPLRWRIGSPPYRPERSETSHRRKPLPGYF